MQLLILALKNWFPYDKIKWTIISANLGNISIRAALVLQFLCCDNSMMAGIRDYYNLSVPITF